MKIIKNILKITAITLTAFIITGCNAEEDHPESPIFSNVDLIEVDYTGGSFVFYDMPSKVEYVVLGIFTSDHIDTSGRSIINISDWEYGSNTGLEGFSRTKVVKGNLYQFDKTAKKYTTSTYQTNIPNATYSWAVWGFDSDTNIIVSSSLQTDTFSNP